VLPILIDGDRIFSSLNIGRGWRRPNSTTGYSFRGMHGDRQEIR
jgi:hypothetical protein